jgi:hypothetical protein
MLGITDGRDLLKWLRVAYKPSFTRIEKGNQEILRFCLSNLNGCNVDITDLRDL